MEVKNLKKNMTVLSKKGLTTIDCVVKLKYTGVLLKIKNMVFTAYHPFLIENIDAYDNENDNKNIKNKNHNIKTFFPCEFFVDGADAKFIEKKNLNNKNNINEDEDYVYDVVLKNRSLIACFNNNINNDNNNNSNKNKNINEIMYAATFGHDCVLKKFKHDYFGSEKIVNDLKKHENYDTTGFIQLDEYEFERDVKTNLVSKLKF
jgi:hypothetical protein